MFIKIFGILFILVLILWFIDMKLKEKPAYKVAKEIPGTKMYPIVGNLFDILLMAPEKTFQYLRNRAHLYKKSNRFWIFGVLHYNVIRAHDIEVLLSGTKYISKSEVYSFLNPLMGTGLLTSTGTKWFQRRRILTPAFHFNILQDFLVTFREESHKLINKLKQTSHQTEIILQEIIPRFTLNTICESAMGVKIDEIHGSDSYRKNLHSVFKTLLFRITNPCIHPNTAYKLSGLQFVINYFLKPVHSFSWGIIDKRRKTFQQSKLIKDSITNNNNNNDNNNNNNDENIYFNKKKRYAMLDTLFAAEADGGQIDENGIREEVDTFMFEGYDTTSAAITFSLLMLAHHQVQQKRVYEEIMEILNDRHEDELTVQDFNLMKYFDRFIKETLRLYPPVSFMGRELQEPLKIDNIELPIGTQIHIHSYDLHRDPDQFPDPERFDPDRFLPEIQEKRHPFAYVAFSAGPRNCIGQKYAMLEIKTLITHILLNYHLTPITRVEDVTFVADIVLRPKNQIKVKFNTRSLDEITVVVETSSSSSSSSSPLLLLSSSEDINTKITISENI